MKGMPAITACLVFGVMGSLAPGMARADDDQARRQVYEQARDAFQAQQWEQARAFYGQLWNERHTYDVALQLGLTEFNLKRLRDAAEHLAYGLMLLPPREKAETAERAEQILGLCKLEVGTVDLRVKNKGADVFVDGAFVTSAPLVTEIFVEPGEHAFEVRLEGHAPEAFTLMLDAGQATARVVELKPLVAQNAAAPATPTPTRSVASPTKLPTSAPVATSHASWTPILASGLLTIVGVSAGVGFQLVRNAREDESERIRADLSRNQCAGSSPGLPDGCDRLKELAADFDRYGRFELASFIVGGLALIGGSTYFVLARPDRAKPPTWANWGPLRFRSDITTHRGQIMVSADF